MSSQPRTMPAAPRLRRATPRDAHRCGILAYEAFKDIAERHGFPPDFPSADVAAGLLSMLFSHPQFYAVVAELDGQIVGSNCLDERSSIGGIGPITIDPAVQNGGIGRALMLDVMERARQSTPAGVRLLQAAYHNRSLSLYSKLGFDAQEPISVLNGDLKPRRIPGYDVRPAVATDAAACASLCIAAHGHERNGDLLDGVQTGSAAVVERHGRITGYTSGLGFFGHTLGETDEDVQALIASASSFGGPGILVPTRSARLFRWCLNSGLRVVMPMTLMSIGLYHQPRLSWMPSILY